MFVNYFLSIFLSISVSLVVTPITRHFFVKCHWVEDPLKKNKKTNNATALKSVPRGGGVPIFIAVFVTSLLFLPLNKPLLGILLSALITLAIGLWDDIVDISPNVRLIFNFIVAIIIVFSGIDILYLSHPFGGIIDLRSLYFLPHLFAIFWIVFCLNIVGWSSGIEGQLPGFVAISAIFIGILGLKFSQDISQWPLIILAGAVAGAYLGFLPYNFFPQSIMPGYSGKSLAGLFLGVLSILSGAKLATIILLLGIPIIDAVYVLGKRLLSGRSPLIGGPDHLHHALLKSGWSRSQIAYLYWFLSLILGIISLFLNSQQKIYVFLGLILLFIGLTLKVSRRI